MCFEKCIFLIVTEIIFLGKTKLLIQVDSMCLFSAKSWNQHFLEAHTHATCQYLHRRVKLVEGLKFYNMHMVTIFSTRKIRTHIDK